MARSGDRKTPASPRAPKPGKPPAPRKGGANPGLTAQTRKVMGKHYAAKYGVRKERG